MWFSELADFRDENNCYSGSYREGRVFNIKVSLKLICILILLILLYWLNAIFQNMIYLLYIWKYFEEEMVKNEIEADHLSVRLAYSAYKNWQSKDHANETRLSIGELSTSQSFFLSYAQVILEQLLR